MKKALINPNCNNQVQDVQPQDFNVVPPLFWVDCPDDIIAYGFNYDPDTGEFIDLFPPPPPAPAPAPVLEPVPEANTSANTAQP